MEKVEQINEDVIYCNNCLSLGVLSKTVIDDKKVETEVDLCITCGSVDDIGSRTFSEWESIYVKRYGNKFIEK